MNRLKIPVLPHIVNALIILSIFSTTNSYVFSASRSMVGLAHRGMAPKILLRQSKRGLPYIAVTIVLLATCLSYLAVSAQTAVVLNWWISLVGSATLINWTGIGL
jgi:amino acid transporter